MLLWMLLCVWFLFAMIVLSYSKYSILGSMRIIAMPLSLNSIFYMINIISGSLLLHLRIHSFILGSMRIIAMPTLAELIIILVLLLMFVYHSLIVGAAFERIKEANESKYSS